MSKKNRNRNVYVPTFEKVVNSMTELVCVVGLDSRIILANSSLTRVTGAQVGDNCPFEECEYANCDRCFYIKNSKDANIENTRNGRIYEISINPMIDNNGNCRYISQIWKDITGEYHLKNKLQKQNDSLRNDLRIASSLQRSMLKDEFPNIKNLKINGLYKPCESVGGDFYDVFKINENRILFYMADVSGHGVGAAMLTVFFVQAVTQIMHNRAKSIPPNKLLHQIWRRFTSLNLEEYMYITAWVGILDTSSGKLEYCNAGHISPPILSDKNGLKHLEALGTPICRWTEKPEFRNQSVNLLKNSRILVFTDGLSDAFRNTDNKANIYGGINAAEDIAMEHLINDSFDNCLTNIWSDIMSNVSNKKLDDDVAMLMLEYK